MAYFEEPQIVVAQFLAVAHFDYVCGVIMTKLLGLASEVIAAEVFSKKKSHCLPSAKDNLSSGGIGVDLRRKGHCASDSWVLVRMAVHMHQYFSTSFDLHTHY